MTTFDEAKMREMATGLLAWGRGLFGIAVSDVYAWQAGKVACLAFAGDPVRLERLMQQPLRNYESRMDIALGRAFNFPVEIRRSGMRVDYVTPHLFSDQLVFVELVEGIERAMREVLGEEAAVRFTVTPAPGEPYAHAPTKFFSAKKQRFQTSTKPSWIIEVTYRDVREDKTVTRPGGNFCMLAPTLKVERSGIEAVTLDDKHTMIVTHALDLKDMPRAMAGAKSIVACGGMLFPSFAVGTIPAANFGPVVLVADPAIVLDGLKPYRRGRGVWPVVVYSTDTWTSRSSDLIGHAAATLYDQLTGNWDIDLYTQLHLWVLGPEVEADGGPAGGKRLDSMSTVATTVRRRMKPWETINTVAQLEKIKDKMGQSEAWYAYLEAKSHTVVPMHWFVAAFVPTWERVKAQKWLSAAGFSGKLYAMDTPDETRQAYDPAHEGMSMNGADLQKLLWARAVGEAARKTLKTAPALF